MHSLALFEDANGQSSSFISLHNNQAGLCTVLSSTSTYRLGNTMISAHFKHMTVHLSNFVIIAVWAALLIKNWDQTAFDEFVNKRLEKSWPLILFLAFVLVMPTMPKPSEERSKAATPTVFQARCMALLTAVMDYAIVGAAFFCWNSYLGADHADQVLCPFSSGCSFFLISVALALKDDIQGRIIWKNFTSRAKLNAWPYTWKFAARQVFKMVPFEFLSVAGLVSSGFVEFPSISSPSVLFKIWLEAAAALHLTEAIIMQFAHKWMHQKAYCLHKTHHEGTSDASIVSRDTFDLLDLMLEVGCGIPLLLGVKWLLGLDPKVHLLSHHLTLLIGAQSHSMNPYAVTAFNPVLDYFMRSAVYHNIHHAVQKGYYGQIPFSHLISPSARCKDIDIYNKYMKTRFPRDV